MNAEQYELCQPPGLRSPAGVAAAICWLTAAEHRMVIAHMAAATTRDESGAELLEAALHCITRERAA